MDFSRSVLLLTDIIVKVFKLTSRHVYVHLIMVTFTLLTANRDNFTAAQSAYTSSLPDQLGELIKTDTHI